MTKIYFGFLEKRSNTTISEEIKSGQDERVLERWNHQQQEWAEISHRLGTITKRPEEDLAMSRGAILYSYIL